MAENPILFPMANPVPEIMPELAKSAGAAVIGTGRSDFPNQINNVLAFPGIFRGTLDVRASDINDEMKIAAAEAIASIVSDEELNADYVKYARFLGIKDRKIVGYVFRNAMLPQVTGLALSIGTMIGGALVAEIIFSYPGLGSTMYTAVTAADYPLISATTLIITIMVLIVTFFLDIIYGFIDPRVKAAQFD